MRVKKEIIPAILTDNLVDFENKVRKIEGIANWLQIDIMDGKFVKNISVSLADLKKIKIPFNLEIHLMVLNPEKYFKECQALKAKRVIFHLEAAKDPLSVLKEMKKYSFERGMALNPETPIEKIKPYLKYLDLVLLLGVTPGFQGQKFNPIVFKKIKQLSKIGKKIKIGVDGGIKFSNIKKIAMTRVDNLVVGSYLFQSKNISRAFKELETMIEKIKN